MKLEDILEELRDLNLDVPIPPRLPSPDEVDVEEKTIGKKFHPDFREYLLRASDIVYGTKEPVTITSPNSHTHLSTVIEDAKEMGLPDELMPLCEDNGDFFAVDEKGSVVYWSHNGVTDESWATIAHWIKDIWIGE